MRSTRTLLFLLALVAAPETRAAGADDSFSQQPYGGDYFLSDRSRPLRDFPPMNTLTAIPSSIDPAAGQTILFECQIFAATLRAAVEATNKAKGTYAVAVYLLDENRRTVETFFVKSGRFRTDSNGSAFIRIDIDPDSFADRLNSGNVSAWVRSTVRFTKKKGNTIQVDCSSTIS